MQLTVHSTVSKQTLLTFFLFAVLPLYSVPFIVGGMLKREKYAFVLWAFFMGMLGILYPPVGDIYRYTQDFLLYKDCSWTFFLELLSLKFDFLLSFLSYGVGRLGLEFEVCKFIYNFIAYYLLGLIYLDILKKKEQQLCCISPYYLLGFFISFNIITYLWRFGFSSALFTYGAYRIIYCHKKDGWIFALLSVFNHFSFLLFFFALCLQRLHFFRLKKWLVALMCICALFINGDLLASMLPYLPLDIAQRYSTYIDGYYATEYFADYSWRYQLHVFLNSFIVYTACFFYVMIYKNDKKEDLSITNGILCLACLSLPFDTMRMRFLALLLLFIKIVFLWRYDGAKWKRFGLRCMFWCMMVGNLMSIWSVRRQLSLGDYSMLFYSSSFAVISHSYDENWISKHVYEDGTY